ncbi:undecaprenyldiphospho-muramoylpentapeptide beta-N-acetylglucosaminyltransferase [Cellvibrio japonicus]|uniref:UDP-N-acetylglucosamine--N-acetylmuramyl-(pentapeptide) pyrophosphoryl-undecaprenol N-acetylglucosamine transferase n=1 Tax=Cellvibrio japonicus (strain Ueda107) TaxID=498211 RepID=MURG_CELJU|nr:undecaprenyldiphospho-muramoylpentapeptide beta-N-acetylglucosaminyltransferase [Cellvibrio japonicus]B3PCM0.1 RecName: Full=UDP-N-acetylglucosamine--N-acetylmuramyl-(pentapeptide) pyrophosphoryl-undecaprenol N-acetylglucosamine transferase; AltName: Full=Undecaprenyl-PP-MurNAc-pentapeptide-UDPGlcNAc GlcNAc transferase [Cellvibrio japonicus Ueda107]ACE84592.1 mur beta-N-acetylglucosaminyltransferase, putative, mur28A [Cellvibrio japonicus Ueda107]QEI13245.1 undecaprenyldiphospho-muramoylpenta
MKTLSILVMAGGTGGHVFPALAVAEELRARGALVEWLGTAKGIENTLVPKANIPLNLISVEGVRGRGLTGLLKAPFLITKAVFQAISIIRKMNADLVLGFGGFASGPGGVAARLLGKPLVIHEQNAVAGTTNRLLARIAQRVLAAFDGAFHNTSTRVVKVVGNPVRPSIYQLPPVAERYQARAQEHPHLLVLGGSLGAKAINELLPMALAQLNEGQRPEVWHQTGKAHGESTAALYLQQQVNARVEPFIEDMAAAYAWADLVICRAGALTVSELMAAGVASALIPLPTAIDDHQTRNAHILASANAGVALVQQTLTAADLAALLSTTLADRPALMAMAQRAQHLAHPNAAATVANVCVEVAHG